MSEYGSVRQYRNRILKMVRAREYSPTAVTCRTCSGMALPCDSCSELCASEWGPAVAEYYPPSARRLPVGSTANSREMLR